MAQTYTKTLKKAVPTVRTADGVVTEWELEVICVADSNGWKTTYNEREEVEYLGKTPEQFTKAELLAMVQINDHVFDAHWQAHNTPAVTERKPDFPLTSLPNE